VTQARSAPFRTELREAFARLSIELRLDRRPTHLGDSRSPPSRSSNHAREIGRSNYSFAGLLFTRARRDDLVQHAAAAPASLIVSPSRCLECSCSPGWSADICGSATAFRASLFSPRVIAIFRARKLFGFGHHRRVFGTRAPTPVWVGRPASSARPWVRSRTQSARSLGERDFFHPHPVQSSQPARQGDRVPPAGVEGGWTAGDGPFTRQCNELLERELGVADVLLTTSCTHAIGDGGTASRREPGDEVVVPAFTFVSTVNAFVLRGARPVFVDIRRDTLNLDETLIEPRLSARTKAIVPVHYAGVGCRDAADPRGRRPPRHRRGRGQCTRTLREVLRPLARYVRSASAPELHETKNFGCGEGGALLVNDRGYADRAEVLREKGTNRSRYFRGQVEKYTWIDVGSSYLPSDLLAAFLYAQLEVWRGVQHKRRQVWERYHAGLADWREAAGRAGADRSRRVRAVVSHVYLLLPSLEARQSLIAPPALPGHSRRVPLSAPSSLGDAAGDSADSLEIVPSPRT